MENNMINKHYEFGLVPSDWQLKTLGDMFQDLKAGSTPSRRIPEYYTGDIPWITSGELNYNIIIETNENITWEAIKDTNLKLYPIGTFFIAITGLEAAGTRGSCAICGVEATTNQSCIAFTPKSTFSNVYLFYWYQLHGERLAFRHAQGTKQQSFNNKLVAGFKIPVPPLQEQKKIAEILSSVDNHIDEVDSMIKDLKELKKGLMQKLLTEGIGHTEFKDSPVGRIPVEWEVVKFNEVIDLGPQNGLYKPNEFYNIGDSLIVALKDLYIKGKYVTSEKLNKIDIIESEKLLYELFDCDLLVNRVSKAVDGVARIKLFSKCLKTVVFESNMMRVRLKHSIYPLFMYYYSEGVSFRKEIARIAKTSNQTSISQGGLIGVAIPVLPLPEQKEIAEILTLVDNRIEEYEEEQKDYLELKKGLMQQLLTGKVRVKLNN